MLAHHAVKVCKTLEVEYLLWWRLAAHACVPLVVTLDKTDDATTAVAEQRLLIVRGIVGNKLWLCAGSRGGLDGAHNHVCVSLSDLEGSVDLVGVVVCADILKRRLVLGLEVLAAGLRQVGGWDGNLKEWQNRRDCFDGGNVEVFPAAKIADVPPEVVADASWCACDTANQSWRRVWGRKVLHERRGGSRDRLEGVEAYICE